MSTQIRETIQVSKVKCSVSLRSIYLLALKRYSAPIYRRTTTLGTSIIFRGALHYLHFGL